MLLDGFAAAVAESARFDLGVERREDLGGREAHGLLGLGADEDVEEFVVDRHVDLRVARIWA